MTTKTLADIWYLLFSINFLIIGLFEEKTICFKTLVLVALWFSYTHMHLLGFGICHRKEVLMTFPYFFLDYLKICDQWTLSCCEKHACILPYKAGWVYYSMDKASMKSYLIFLSSLLFLMIFLPRKELALLLAVKKTFSTLSLFFFQTWSMIIYYYIEQLI